MNQLNLTLNFSNDQLIALATVAESRGLTIAEMIEVSMSALYPVPVPVSITVDTRPEWMKEYLTVRASHVLLNANIETPDALQTALEQMPMSWWRSLPNCGRHVYNELRRYYGMPEVATL